MGPLPRFAALIWVLVAIGVAHADSIRMPRKDTSLPLKEYLDKGMPAPDKQWSEADFMKAAEVLKSLPDPTTYPRLGSLKSGVLFARMSDTSELASIKQKTPNEQMTRLRDLRAIKAVSLPYFTADNAQKCNYEREIVAFLTDALAVDKAILDVLGEAKSTAPTPQLAAQVDEPLKKLAQEAAMDIVDSARYLYVDPPMSDGEHRHLFEALRDRVPPLMKALELPRQPLHRG